MICRWELTRNFMQYHHESFIVRRLSFTSLCFVHRFCLMITLSRLWRWKDLRSLFLLRQKWKNGKLNLWVGNSLLRFDTSLDLITVTSLLFRFQNLMQDIVESWLKVCENALPYNLCRKKKKQKETLNAGWTHPYTSPMVTVYLSPNTCAHCMFWSLQISFLSAVNDNKAVCTVPSCLPIIQCLATGTPTFFVACSILFFVIQTGPSFMAIFGAHLFVRGYSSTDARRRREIPNSR